MLMMTLYRELSSRETFLLCLVGWCLPLLSSTAWRPEYVVRAVSSRGPMMSEPPPMRWQDMRRSNQSKRDQARVKMPEIERSP